MVLIKNRYYSNEKYVVVVYTIALVSFINWTPALQNACQPTTCPPKEERGDLVLNINKYLQTRLNQLWRFTISIRLPSRVMNPQPPDWEDSPLRGLQATQELRNSFVTFNNTLHFCYNIQEGAWITFKQLSHQIWAQGIFNQKTMVPGTKVIHTVQPRYLRTGLLRKLKRSWRKYDIPWFFLSRKL